MSRFSSSLRTTGMSFGYCQRMAALSWRLTEYRLSSPRKRSLARPTWFYWVFKVTSACQRHRVSACQRIYANWHSMGSSWLCDCHERRWKLCQPENREIYGNLMGGKSKRKLCQMTVFRWEARSPHTRPWAVVQHHTNIHSERQTVVNLRRDDLQLTFLFV